MANLPSFILNNDYLRYLIELSAGLPATLIISFSSIILAFFIAVFFSIQLKIRQSIWINRIINQFVLFFTGTPLLVQILIFYNLFPFIQHHIFAMNKELYEYISSPWVAAIIALTLNSAAYSTKIFYGSFKAIPFGMQEACETIGMNRFQTLKIIIPYGLRRALSTYANEIIFVVKGSALVSTITIMDVTGYYHKIMGTDINFMVLIAAATIYLTINILLSFTMRIIEYYSLKFERTS